MTIVTLKSSAHEVRTDSYLVLLDRSYWNLLQCKRKLESYRFEPRTLRQFELKQRLLDGMEVLVKHYNELSQLARRRGRLMAIHITLIKNYLVETRTLEEEFQEYIGIAHLTL